jgi:plastocyanin
VQLAFISPARSVLINACSAALTVQLQDACGTPVIAAADVPLSLTSSSPSMQLFSEGTCSTTPFTWSVPAGASQLDLNVTDPAPGLPRLTASSAGLDAGSQVVTVSCAAGQRACPNGCVPGAGCCDDAECTAGGLPWVCDTTSRLCAPPPCTGFPANCTSFEDHTASGASRTITFDSTGYLPKCMRVSTFQDVTFSGSFAIHPLQQVCGPSNSNLTTTFGTTKTARFPSFGTYGYRCANHPVFEQGAIRVP